ncbi:MAG: hypothetical protein ACTHQQ_03055 [Solirubrobacteraceae bacterium]
MRKCSVRNKGAPDIEVNTATIRPDGSGLRWLTGYPPGGTLANGNSYSPDGRWIVLRGRTGRPLSAVRDPPDGTALQPITSFSTLRPGKMAWAA